MAHEKISGDTLFYFQKVTPPDWHDETVGKLTPEDIDSNFYTLKSMDIRDITFKDGVLSFVKYDCEQSIDINLNLSAYTTSADVEMEIGQAVKLLEDWVNENINRIDEEISATTIELGSEITSAMTEIDTLRTEVISALTAYNAEINKFETGVEDVIGCLLSQFKEFKFEVYKQLHEMEKHVARAHYVNVEFDESLGKVKGQGGYVRQAMARLLAEPNDGYMFVGWDDGTAKCADWSLIFNNPWYFTVDNDWKIKAIFARRIPLTVYNCEPDAGIIELNYMNGDVVVNEKEISYYVPDGYSVKLKALPFEGYKFVGWSNGEKSEEIEISPTEQTYIKAFFEAN